MKTKLFTLLLLLSAAIASAETMRVAILEPVDRENKVSYGVKLMLRSNLAKAVTNTEGYEAFDRSDIDAIMGEQNFQRTGMVSEDQIKRLGEMTGAKYILVAEAAMIDAKNMFITAKVLDVETAKTIMIDNLMMETDAKKIQEGCATLAGKLFKMTPSTPIATTTSKTNSKKETTTNEYAIKIVKNSKKEMKLYGLSTYSYGETYMNRKEMETFLKENCVTAYKKYKSGKQLQYSGWSILGGGAFMLIMGCAFVGDGTDGPPIAFIAAGASVMTTIGIPLLSVGYYRTNHAHEIFNQQCAREYKLTLNLQASQNGVGLALNF